jgi:Fe-S cluster biogenesis protein NfuA
MPPVVPIPAEGPPLLRKCLGENGAAPEPDAMAENPVRRLDALLAQVQALPNPAARALVHECLQAVLALHGEALEKILEIVHGTGSDRHPSYERLISDPIVSGLLHIHGLHPVPIETRLRQALDKVRPYLLSHGGNVELLSLEAGAAKLRLQGTCKTCPSSNVTLELAVRRAIEEACPDLSGFEVV